MVEHIVHIDGVTGSSPVATTREALESQGSRAFISAQCFKSCQKAAVGGLSLSKKSACGGLFRQKLKKCLRPGAQTPRPPGTGGKRQPCGLLREAQSDPKVGSETSGGRGQRPPRRLSDRGKPGDTNSLWRGRREASAQWAVATEGGKATRRSQPKRAADAASGRRDD